MHRLFAVIVRFPLLVALCGLAAIAFFGLQAFDLEKDTRAEVFIPADHPAVSDRERLIETFGLKDPVIIAIFRDQAGGIFNPDTLALTRELTFGLSQVPGIDPERVTSLATEKSITGDTLGLSVERFVSEDPESLEEAAEVRAKVEATPSVLGRLVSPDHQVALVVAELLDGADAEQIYWDVLDLVENTTPGNGEELHVAGTGAMLGYLGIYIDRDAMTLAPIATLLVVISLFLAHRSLLGVVVPGLVILGSVAVTLGAMALSETRFYIITNALPVILIGIAVDDALHILGEYRNRRAGAARSEPNDLVIGAMLAMAKPVSITTLTTAAGCLALGFSSEIPPMREFGLFAALGIGVAWLFSLTVVPAVLVIHARRAGASVEQSASRERPGSGDAPAFRLLTQPIFAAPGKIVAAAALLLCASVAAATSLQVDEAYIDNLRPYEPIVVADRLINERGIGSNYVDLMIEGGEEDALLRPEVLGYVSRLQAYAESLPGVLQSVSYLDSLRQIERALEEPGEPAQSVLESEDIAAQYLLLYSMSGDPADFRSLLNNSYQNANLRLYLDSGWFSDEIEVLDSLRSHLSAHPPPEGIVATLSGIAMVHVSWVGMLFDGHLTSVVASLLVVWLIAAVSFRSPLRGSLVMVPVIFAVMTVYATMALTGISLAVGTSMTAAIAIGLSVDFGVHLLHRIDHHCRSGLLALKEALRRAIGDSGRAIFFGFLTGFLGFGVLVVSEVPGVARFGGLVAVSLAASLLACLALLPSLVLAIKPLGAKLMPGAGAQAAPSSSHQPEPGKEICSSVKSSALSP